MNGAQNLVTGVNSGLGKSVFESVGGLGLSRSNRSSLISECKISGVDTIVHCAFGAQGGYEQFELEDYYKYVDDNILLTKELLDIPHNRFVYVSSLVVYEEGYNNYKMTKLYCESMVQKLSKNNLILRCPAILSLNMKRNNLIRLVEDDNPKLSLTGDSNFNYVTDSDIIDFIFNCDSTGTFDFVSSKNIELKEISSMINKEASFGQYRFRTPEVSNKKLIGSWPKMNKTSQETLEQFLTSRKI